MKAGRGCRNKPSPPSAKMMSASAGAVSPYCFASAARASWASAIGLATKAIRGWDLFIGQGLAATRAAGRWEDAHERRARGFRLYDLSIPCRGGADRKGRAGEIGRAHV